jgi:hypothetical protein
MPYPLTINPEAELDAEFHQALDARPMETAIDLSQPGETTVPFRQRKS